MRKGIIKFGILAFLGFEMISLTSCSNRIYDSKYCDYELVDYSNHSEVTSNDVSKICDTFYSYIGDIIHKSYLGTVGTDLNYAWYKYKDFKYEQYDCNVSYEKGKKEYAKISDSMIEMEHDYDRNILLQRKESLTGIYSKIEDKDPVKIEELIFEGFGKTANVDLIQKTYSYSSLDLYNYYNQHLSVINSIVGKAVNHSFDVSDEDSYYFIDDDKLIITYDTKKDIDKSDKTGSSEIITQYVFTKNSISYHYEYHSDTNSTDSSKVRDDSTYMKIEFKKVDLNKVDLSNYSVAKYN